MAISEILQSCAALLAVVAILLSVRPLLRRVNALRSSGLNGAINVQGALNLDRNRRLMLIDCDGARALVLIGGTRDIVLPWPPGEKSSP
ncbi:hypothetical protein AA101099_1843 [Neoasaia chiangmaiensis NBRC 101099]|uniref:flagellar biosynthetic protein FliO n=1 Tax=Neoasaia chiangmaiensis TaxID=320497 RepID=UPI00118F9446|nr:flagellar biosynthetic protein FliO [Neoasaia chiangmaiensis]GBR39845.1 hypothetical protein AA101099_1843 [Neoasaia chiangmaiensis NBRC 101099]GEN14767.1 hypothetical protein NCH01_11980 [Neoasaia chiangmaiensis]